MMILTINSHYIKQNKMGKLTIEELLFLCCFIDDYKSKHILEDNTIYKHIEYEQFCEEFPVFTLEKWQFTEMLRQLVIKGMLTIKIANDNTKYWAVTSNVDSIIE